MTTDIYRPTRSPGGLRPEDRRFVVPVAEALATILEPSPGHTLTVNGVHRALRQRAGVNVQFAPLRRILAAAGVRLEPEPGSGETLVRDVRFTTEATQ